MPLNTLPIGCSTISGRRSASTHERRISDTANMPIIIGIS